MTTLQRQAILRVNSIMHSFLQRIATAITMLRKSYPENAKKTRVNGRGIFKRQNDKRANLMSQLQQKKTLRIEKIAPESNFVLTVADSNAILSMIVTGRKLFITITVNQAVKDSYIYNSMESEAPTRTRLNSKSDVLQ